MAALETVTKEASVFMMRWEIKNAFAQMVLSDKKMEPAEVSYLVKLSLHQFFSDV